MRTKKLAKPQRQEWINYILYTRYTVPKLSTSKEGAEAAMNAQNYISALGRTTLTNTE